LELLLMQVDQTYVLLALLQLNLDELSLLKYFLIVIL